MLKVKVKKDVSDAKSDCPPATQDAKVNLKNRNHAIEEYGYGPPNPKKPNEEFWSKKEKLWGVGKEDLKEMTCGACGAFDQSEKMLNCIKLGLGKETVADAYESVLDRSELGFCEMYKFKCAASRTCDSWVAKK